jgi:hypothetical protein
MCLLVVNGAPLLAPIVHLAKVLMKNTLIYISLTALVAVSFFCEPIIPGVQTAFMGSIVPVIMGIISAATAIGGAVANKNAQDQSNASSAKDREWRERQQAAEIELRKKQVAQQQQQAAMDMLQGAANTQMNQNTLSAADQQSVSNQTASDLAKAFLSKR